MFGDCFCGSDCQQFVAFFIEYEIEFEEWFQLVVEVRACFVDFFRDRV